METYLILIAVGAILGFILADYRFKIREKKYKDELAIIVHQFRTPLTKIGWILEELKNDPMDRIELIANAKTTASEMITMVNDFLNNFSVDNLQKNKGKKSDLGEIVNDVYRSYQFIAEKRGIVFRFKKAAGTPIVNINKKNLMIELKNVVDNSFEYTPNGGQIELGYQRRGNAAEITVTDSGIGIPENARKNVTKKFFRAENAKKRGQGSGLGLYITKKIMEKYGGKIFIESKENKGTTVVLRIPL